jgi:hypothetical protein
LIPLGLVEIYRMLDEEVAALVSSDTQVYAIRRHLPLRTPPPGLGLPPLDVLFLPGGEGGGPPGEKTASIQAPGGTISPR